MSSRRALYALLFIVPQSLRYFSSIRRRAHKRRKTIEHALKNRTCVPYESGRTTDKSRRTRRETFATASGKQLKSYRNYRETVVGPRQVLRTENQLARPRPPTSGAAGGPSGCVPERSPVDDVPRKAAQLVFSVHDVVCCGRPNEIVSRNRDTTRRFRVVANIRFRKAGPIHDAVCRRGLSARADRRVYASFFSCNCTGSEICTVFQK